MQRRPLPAVTPEDSRRRLLTAFLDLYDLTPPFLDALSEAYRACCVGHEQWVVDLWWHEAEALGTAVTTSTPYSKGRDRRFQEWARDYYLALSAVGTRFGLHRLPTGVQHLHFSYCWLAAHRTLDGNPPSFPIRKSPYSVGVGVSLVESVKVPTLEDETDVVVHMQDAWHPVREARSEARRRFVGQLTRQLDSELDRIAAAALRFGLTFPDTAPKEAKHLKWLFEHVALNKSYPEIAQEYLGSRALFKSVEGRVREIAERLGLSLSRHLEIPRFKAPT
jgi:hypothetical protein